MKQQAKKGIRNHESEVKEDHTCLQQNVYDMTRLIVTDQEFSQFYHSCMDVMTVKCYHHHV